MLAFSSCGRGNEINPLSANITKWSNKLKQFVGNLKSKFLFRAQINIYDGVFLWKFVKD